MACRGDGVTGRSGRNPHASVGRVMTPSLGACRSGALDASPWTRDHGEGGQGHRTGTDASDGRLRFGAVGGGPLVRLVRLNSCVAADRLSERSTVGTPPSAHSAPCRPAYPPRLVGSQQEPRLTPS